MRTIDLEDYWEEIRKRKLELGIEETPEFIESLRNKGLRRTAAKREALRLARRRAEQAGLDPVGCVPEGG